MPPETRPVGQVIAEALRRYGNSFWLLLPIGLPVAVTNQVSAGRSFWVQVVVLAAATPLLTAAYIVACLVVTKERPPSRVIATAFFAGVLVILPVPLLLLIYVLPALAWLALVGLVVPVLLVERKAGRVVAAVLEACQTLEQQGLAGSGPDVSDDAAHREPSSFVGCVRIPTENPSQNARKARPPRPAPASERISRARVVRGPRC